MEKILTWEEAEEMSGFTERQLKKAVANADLKAYWKNSKEYGVTEKTLEEFQKKQEVKPFQLRRV